MTITLDEFAERVLNPAMWDLFYAVYGFCDPECVVCARGEPMSVPGHLNPRTSVSDETKGLETVRRA